MTWKHFDCQRDDDGVVRLTFTRPDSLNSLTFDVYGTLICSGVGDISLSEDGGRDELIRDLMTDQGIMINAGTTEDASWGGLSVVVRTPRRFVEGDTIELIVACDIMVLGS